MHEKSLQDVELVAPLWLKKNSQAFLERRRIELLENIEEHGSISKAAKVIGMSYKGAWDAINGMNNVADRPLTINVVGGKSGGGTVLTDEGRRLVRMFRMVEVEQGRALAHIGKNVDDLERIMSLLRRISMRISAKNVYYGLVRDIRVENLLAEVCLELKSGQMIFSVITTESLETLGLVVGEGAYAVVKASSVMISGTGGVGRLSARNRLSGQVVKVRTDAVMGELVLDIGNGDTISATVTASGAARLCLGEGDAAYAIVDASNVIIGVA